MLLDVSTQRKPLGNSGIFSGIQREEGLKRSMPLIVKTMESEDRGTYYDKPFSLEGSQFRATTGLQGNEMKVFENGGTPNPVEYSRTTYKY